MTNPKVANAPLLDYSVESETQDDGSFRQVVSTINKYQISDIDDAADPKYYGYLDLNGSWYILRNTGDTTYRYVFGTANYSTNWTSRASLTYGYYNEGA